MLLEFASRVIDLTESLPQTRADVGCSMFEGSGRRKPQVGWPMAVTLASRTLLGRMSLSWVTWCQLLEVRQHLATFKKLRRLVD